MDLDNIENLNEEQIIEMYDDVIENNEDTFILADYALNCCKRNFGGSSGMSGTCKSAYSASCTKNGIFQGYAACSSCK